MTVQDLMGRPYKIAKSPVLEVSIVEEDGGAVGDAVRGMNRSFAGYQCDFSDRAAVRAFAEKVLQDYPTIDILVNNAGTIKRKPAAEHEDELWDEVIETNLSLRLTGY